MKSVIIFVCALCSTIGVMGQSISGQLSQYAQKEIKLEGFDGIQTYTIASVQTDLQGKFILSYTAVDYGMGYLITPESKPFLVLLSGENIEIAGTSLEFIETIKTTKSKENQWFEQFSQEHTKREQALSAWTKVWPVALHSVPR